MLLSIESSCDESALALFDPQKGLTQEWVHSQLDIHQVYGGVVPDLASRAHLEQFGPLLEQLDSTPLTHIAVTHGPGLASCLAMGVALGKALSLALDIPLVGVNHLRAHAFSPFIQLHQDNPQSFDSVFESYLPHLGLLVSGGNTLLFSINKQKQLTVLAQTVDDAAGEALDKGAKLLGMPYPGGPLIEKKSLTGDPRKYSFPKAFTKSSEMAFSFSGLKTSLRYLLEKMVDDLAEQELQHICASYQQTVIDSLSLKVDQLLQKETWASVGLSGGVANNKLLQSTLQQVASNHQTPLFIAQPKHTGDNAGMIAFAAFIDEAHVASNQNWGLKIEPSLSITNNN